MSIGHRAAEMGGSTGAARTDVLKRVVVELGVG